jgi:alpha-tubulin suppressor-like RCC1 family protein
MIKAAVKADGTLWVWGQNYEGQISGYTGNYSSRPVLITGLNKIKRVILSGSYEVLIVVDKNGNSWTWDRQKNIFLKLDQVIGINKVVSLSASTYVLSENGEVWRWGEISGSQVKFTKMPKENKITNIYRDFQDYQSGNLYLIDDKGNVYKNFNKLNHLQNIKSLSFDYYSTIILTKTGKVLVDLSSPKEVTGLNEIVQILPGYHSNKSLRKDGTVWEKNNLSESTPPVQV